MFTGIVQLVGTIEERSDDANGAKLAIDIGRLAAHLKTGDSVSVNGVCLTAERLHGSTAFFTVVGETLAATTLKNVKAGDRVNLENAATPSTALGGHMVQGHIDSVATVKSLLRSGKDYLLELILDEEAFSHAVHKGSIAIDGVSLTVLNPQPDQTIRATIVPHTMENTTIASYRAGTLVNVEVDMIAKYVRHFLAQAGTTNGGAAIE